MARRIRTGSIGINGGVWYGADMPYGGYKDSGIGRQNGIEGFETYLETKLVGINVVFYYGAVLWQSVGFSEADSLKINILSGTLSIAE